ncbi:MAG: hypothetical protein A3H96_00900 [Acidobacteria bacterium RIFCSPLOWO2_02_FULL_67_36]|nr:MAG: hypothetical protein A3H96_00900 [Acidobacteria bacterium RIFCSPLOWO2_02_FULL_67_36]OFW23029.1 MAG: hypothetical protein A3G21_00450 [Acidobacteria bacterium RIFCSPLOWO2_12_FULL_66_21]
MPLEHRLDDAALHTPPAAVNQPHLAQAGLMRRAHVFLDHRRHVAWNKGVQVEGALNRYSMDH